MAREIGEANSVFIYKAKAKIFCSKAPTEGLLLKFITATEANKFIAEGLF